MILNLHHLGRRLWRPPVPCTWSVLSAIKRQLKPPNSQLQRRLLSSGNVGERYSSKKIRQTFIDFFKDEYDHKFVPSSTVIPKKGQGTYFVNAGMNQFKPIFLGTCDPESDMAGYRRAVNSQKCVRLGGKHNDLDDVGLDGYHHTFFEMLGSWSFADYFKEEACSMAWQLLTEVYQLPKDRLYVTYFGGDKKLNLQPDLESRDAWLKLGLPSNRVLPSGMKDNFWMMGNTGPCGPCSEIHFDHIGGRDASHLVNTGSPDVIELWNLVFMQFDRQADHSLIPLPRQHVDTGMGLERITVVLQGKTSNYDTDLFQPLFQQIEQICKAPPYRGQFGADDVNGLDTAYRIVADHSRMASVAIADGLLPGRTKLENKLRQILHRQLKQAHSILGAPQGMLGQLVPVVVDVLGEAFPELEKHQNMIMEVINTTEEKYLSHHISGRKVMEKAISKMQVKDKMSADQMSELHDGCYGQALPLDLIKELAEEKGISLDLKGFDKKLDSIKEQSKLQVDLRTLHITLDQHLIKDLADNGVPATDDSFKYDYTSDNGLYHFPRMESKVVSLIQDGNIVKSVKNGTECGVILDETNFYAEGGGQVSDRGKMVSKDNEHVSFLVRDVQRYQKYILHTGVLENGDLTVGDCVMLDLDQDHREACMCNHTATHIINYALSKVFPNVHQKGSMVTSDRLTFHFNCLESIGKQELSRLQEIVDEIVDAEHATYRRTLPLEVAMGVQGIRTLQDEVYPHNVHVIAIGADIPELLEQTAEGSTCSVELCGGTHVHNTHDIASIVITKLVSIAQGTKGITAVTGKTAIEAQENADDLSRLFEDLQNDIYSGSRPDSWSEQLKKIDTIFSTRLLPKLEKDEIFKEVDQLRTRVKEFNNQQAKEKMKEKLRSCLQTSKDVLVMEFPLDDVKMVAQVISKLDISKPILLISKDKKVMKGLAMVPHDDGSEAKAWLERACEQVKGYKVEKFKGKNLDTIQLLLSKDFDGLGSVMNRASGYQPSTKKR